MTTIPPSAPGTARKDGSSVCKARTDAAPGAGDGLTCGSCPYWHRDDEPGRIEATYAIVNEHGQREYVSRVLDSEPCGWCRYNGVGVGALLVFASHPPCGVEK
jgi:hypothetical protein